jgi:hypothetical protein
MSSKNNGKMGQNNKVVVILYKVLILFYLCWGSHAWFTWWADFFEGFEDILVYSIFAVIAELYRRKMRIGLLYDTKLVLAILCMIIGQVLGSPFGPLLIPRLLLQFYPLYVLLSDYQNTPHILHFLMKCIAFILIPGLILHLIDLSIGLPALIPSIYGDSISYIFFNYGFLLKPIADYESDSGRFFSIFIEPGYLGVLLALLLYASRFDFSKKTTWVLCAGLIASFSLSGIVTALIGFFIIRVCNHNAKKVILPILLLIPVYFVGESYNRGDNYLNNLIIQRLQPDKKKGIAGNNRVGDEFDLYFDRMLNDGSILFGMGGKKATVMLGDKDGMIHGAGYKRYCVINGALSALFFFLFYYFLGIARHKNKNRIYLWGLFTMFVVSFIPLGYPLSTTWLTCIVLGHVNDRNKNAIYT